MEPIDHQVKWVSYAARELDRLALLSQRHLKLLPSTGPKIQRPITPSMSLMVSRPEMILQDEKMKTFLKRLNPT